MRALRLIKSMHPRDHCPLLLLMDIYDCFESIPKMVRLDRDEITTATVEGKERKDFLEKVEQELENSREEFQEVREHIPPAAHWEMFAGKIAAVTQSVFKAGMVDESWEKCGGEDQTA